MTLKARYVVKVDDNFRYMDEEARWTYGQFAKAEAALAMCRHIVDLCLEEAYEPGMLAEELVATYKHFGDDPFIIPLDAAPDCDFSAWSYAEQRAKEICGG
jgi:hypothetical protein